MILAWRTRRVVRNGVQLPDDAETLESVQGRGEYGVGEALLAILLITFPRTTMRPSRTDSSSDPQTAVLAISGMTCGSCVRHVHQALASLEGVHSAQVDRARDLARVAYDPAQVDPEQLVAAVNDAGYDARVTAS